MNAKNQHLDENFVKELTMQGAVIEYCNYLPHNKTGMPSWEIKIKMPDSSRRILIARDAGVRIKKHWVTVNEFASREERNAEIFRLYKEECLSQIFLANLFNITQPSVSLIVKKQKNT